MKRALLTLVGAALVGAFGASRGVADDDRDRGRRMPGYPLPLRGYVEFYGGPPIEFYIDGSARHYGFYDQPYGYSIPGVRHGWGYPPPPDWHYPGRTYPRYGHPYYFDRDWTSGYRRYKHHRGDDDDDDD